VASVKENASNTHFPVFLHIASDPAKIKPIILMARGPLFFLGPGYSPTVQS